MPKSNSNDVFKIQHDMLKKSGAWPIENPTIWYRFKGFMIFLCAVGLGTTMLMEAYHDIQDFAKLSEILYVMITVTTYIIKHIAFFVQGKTFVHIMKLLKDPIFLSYPDDLDNLMVKRIKTSRSIANAYRYLVLACVILMTVSPFVDDQPLPFPFSYDLGQYRTLMFIFQVIAIAIVGWNNPQFDSLTASLIGLTGTQLEILGHKIIRLVADSSTERSLNPVYDDAFSNKITEELKQCVKHHLAIIEVVESIDKVFSFCVLVQFLGSIIIICNTLFNFILVAVGSSQFFMLVNYLTIMISELFMYCWFGNEVIWMSTRIGEACYLLQWYNCNKDVGKYLFILMERSKRPLKITVFKFSILSLSSFTTIIQWSYSYFALLFKLYSKNQRKV